MLCKERSEDLDELAGLIANGTLTPALDQIYPLERVANAMGDLEAGKIRGKSAITAARTRSRIAS
jgi:NADPH:quinone reductase-like Zn-dependent oxidoreductase